MIKGCGHIGTAQGESVPALFAVYHVLHQLKLGPHFDCISDDFLSHCQCPNDHLDPKMRRADSIPELDSEDPRTLPYCSVDWNSISRCCLDPH